MTHTQVSRLSKAFANNHLADIKLSKTWLHKIGQSGRFLGRHLESLLKTGLPLIGNVLKSLTKSILMLLGLTAAAAATDTAIQKKTYGPGTTTLIISTKEMEDMKIVKSLEDFGLLIKSVHEIIQNEAREQKGRFLSILLGTLEASL